MQGRQRLMLKGSTKKATPLRPARGIKKPRKPTTTAGKLARAAWGKVKGIRPEPDEPYKRWIRTLPCLVCFLCDWRAWIWGGDEAIMMAEVSTNGGLGGQVGRTESAHQASYLGIRGLRQKTNDRSCLPLCARCHAFQHKDRFFWVRVGIDHNGVISSLNAQYDRPGGPGAGV